MDSYVGVVAGARSEQLRRRGSGDPPISVIKKVVAEDRLGFKVKSPFFWIGFVSEDIFRDAMNKLFQICDTMNKFVDKILHKEMHEFLAKYEDYAWAETCKIWRDQNIVSDETLKIYEIASNDVLNKNKNDWQPFVSLMKYAEFPKAIDFFKDCMFKLENEMLTDSQAHIWLLLGLDFYTSWTLAKYNDDSLIVFLKIVDCYQKALDKDPENKEHLYYLEFAKRVLLLMPVDIELKKLQRMRGTLMSPLPPFGGPITMDMPTLDNELVRRGRKKSAIFKKWVSEKENKRKRMKDEMDLVQVGVMVAAVSAMITFLFNKD